MNTPLLKIREVASRLNCTERHVRNLLRKGVISRVKLGGPLRFRPDLLEEEIKALERRASHP